MASNPPGECCRKGVKHSGTIAGEMIKIGTVDAYITKPPKSIEKKGAIIYVTDVIGIYENSKLLADEFAASGYFTIMPDLFNGGPLSLIEFSDPVNGATSLSKWLDKHPSQTVDPIIDQTITYLKKEGGYQSVGAVGYCFGAKYVARFLKRGHLDVGFIAHPSFVTTEELTAIQMPLSIAAAETDSIFPAEKRHESEVILQKIGAQYQIALFSGVEHGFAVRADLSIRNSRFAKESAFVQATRWFDEWLENEG